MEEGALAGAEKPPLPSPLHLSLAGKPASSCLTDTEMSNQAMHASIHEDNARTLQGILDTLREILRVPQGQSLVAAARHLVEAKNALEQGVAKSETYHLASQLAFAVSRDDDDPDGHDMGSGLFGPHVSQWLRQVAASMSDQVAPSKGEVAPGDVSIDALESDLQQPHPDGWLQSGGLLYRLTDDRHPQNRDEINVTMADGSRSDESRARRAGELLDRIRATHPAPVPVAPAATSKPGQISASVLKDSIRKLDPNGVVLVEEVWHLLDATPAGRSPISLNALKTRVRNRASAGAILVKDLTAIVETMAHAATNGAADGYQ